MAFDLTGLPLGTVWQKSWARENIGTKLTKQEKNRKRKQAPIEEKESLRWVEGIRAARKVPRAASTLAALALTCTGLRRRCPFGTSHFHHCWMLDAVIHSRPKQWISAFQGELSSIRLQRLCDLSTAWEVFGPELYFFD
jgi:hypothetical protein